jgi:hypothetical protein
LNKSEIRIVIRQLKNAPTLLKDWGLIKQDDNKNYYFPVELLRRWIANYKPLSRVLDDNLT